MQQQRLQLAAVCPNPCADGSARKGAASCHSHVQLRSNSSCAARSSSSSCRLSLSALRRRSASCLSRKSSGSCPQTPPPARRYAGPALRGRCPRSRDSARPCGLRAPEPQPPPPLPLAAANARACSWRCDASRAARSCASPCSRALTRPHSSSLSRLARCACMLSASPRPPRGAARATPTRNGRSGAGPSPGTARQGRGALLARRRPALGPGDAW
jgi:hypothetical protein